jgi:plastocyanin
MNTVPENNLKEQWTFRLGALAVVLTLALVACQGGAPSAQPAAPAAANTPMAAPTDTPAPTAVPTTAPIPTTASTNTPVPAAAPTDTSGPAKAAAMPSVSVADQPIEDDAVTVAKVVSNGPGWIVIHADKNGAPGPVLGYAPVKDGENADVAVKLAAEGRTETLYAMLHTDAGKVGTYEFPGADGPVAMDGKVITPAFKVAGGGSSGATTSQAAAVKLVNMTFTPAQLTVKVGTTVVWTSEDDVPHTVSADDGSFDSGNMKKGDTFEFTFTKAGQYPYYCAYHGTPGGGGMAGTIVVTN